jgi:hypothetical protein
MKKERRKREGREERSNNPPLIISSTVQRLLNRPLSIFLQLPPDLPSEVLVEPTISIDRVLVRMQKTYLSVVVLTLGAIFTA